ncbi:MAG: hypothetical protein N3B13_08515 [Deltaproteobacteria bacterium]|nr:hypothetical protein [Deltaproteobacteria bacterium]
MKRGTIFFLLLLIISCVEKVKVGGKNEPCFENGTCLKGLVCTEEFICIEEVSYEDVETLCEIDCGNSARCVDGRCVCMYGYANCDGNWENGCEVDILNNRFHCGNCLDYCGDKSVCNKGKCECIAGFANADGNWQNGCEKKVELSDTFEAGPDFYDIAGDVAFQDTNESDVVVDSLSDILSGCQNFYCSCGTYCEMVDDLPMCVSGCEVDTDCCEGQYCDKKEKICKKVVKICHSDQECANNPVNKYCDIGDSYECVECTGNQHCDSTKGYFCDTIVKSCIKVQDECNGSCDYTKQFCSTKTNPASCQPKNPDLCKSCSVTMNNCPSPLVCQPIDPMNPFKGGTCGVECYTIEDCFGNQCDTTYHLCVCH